MARLEPRDPRDAEETCQGCVPRGRHDFDGVSATLGADLNGIDENERTTVDRAVDTLNCFRARISNSAVEGMNNKTKVVMRRAYGLRTAD